MDEGKDSQMDCRPYHATSEICLEPYPPILESCRLGHGIVSTSIFLTGVDKRSSLSCQDHEISKSQNDGGFQHSLSFAWIFFDRLGDDVKEGQVIMGCDVLDDISRAVSFKVGWLSNEIF